MFSQRHSKMGLKPSIFHSLQIQGYVFVVVLVFYITYLCIRILRESGIAVPFQTGLASGLTAAKTNLILPPSATRHSSLAPSALPPCGSLAAPLPY